MRKIKNILLAATLVVSICTVSVLGNKSEAKKSDNIQTPVNKFNWTYFDTLKVDNKNKFYSAYSLTEAISLTSNSTSSAMQKVVTNKLGVSSVKSLNSCFKSFNSTLDKTYIKGSLFKNSNLILLDKINNKSHPIDSNFNNVVKSSYNATVKVWDIRNDVGGARKYIKSYVNKATNGFMKNYKSLLKSTDIVDILNAVYFKGDWKVPFGAENTYKENFKNYNKSTTKVDMMHNSSEYFGYYENKNFQIASLPYSTKKGKNLVSMYVIVPKDKNSVNIMKSWKKLSYNSKENMFKKTKIKSNREVSISLPKFEIDNSSDVTSIVTDYLGGYFPKMLKNSTTVLSGVQHTAKVKVDEKGTEAAAVTEMFFDNAVAIESDKEIKVIKCNRPFLFVIRDVKTGTELFTGVINSMK